MARNRVAEVMALEYNDVYDENRQPTGRTHRRGSSWRPGEYGLVVCVWVYDGAGRVLLTKRAKGKSFAGTWENSGGAAKAGETSRQAIARELREETGIRAEEGEFLLLCQDQEGHTIYDFYALKRQVALEDIVLQPGETEDVRWAAFDEVRSLIRRRKICRIIANQYLRQEPMLRQLAQE